MSSSMKMLTPAQATAEGFTIDRHCYPWVAYKGSRFTPHEIRACFTDDEANLLGALKLMVQRWDSSDIEKGANPALDHKSYNAGRNTIAGRLPLAEVRDLLRQFEVR
jgi:hypothetical protein